MVETVSLLSELRNGGYEGAVLTTFNLHIPFLEEVIVRRLHASGCRHIIVLADQNQLAKAIHADTPRRAGYDYFLLPMPTKAAFHPKIMMLAGKSKGFLAVGSHNLTYAGFGHNREVTNAIYYDPKKNPENADTFRSTWNALQRWMESIQIADDSRSILARMPQLAPWLGKESDEASADIELLTGEPGERPLFAKMKEFITSPLAEAFLTGPFFDSKLEFVQEFVNTFEPDQVTIALDPETAHVPAEAQDIDRVDFVKATTIGPKKSNYLHAKIIHATDRDGTQYMFSGSANPSAPAWLREDSRSNHEAMLALRGEKAAAAAEHLGLLSGKEHTLLEKADWDNVAAQWAVRSKAQSQESNHCDIISVSVAEDGSIDVPVKGESQNISVNVIGIDGFSIEPQPKIEVVVAGAALITLPTDQRVSLAQLLENDTLVRLAIVHYPAVLQDKAKTGVQRRFSSAFGSLDSDTPALNDLFKCIEEVINEDQPTALKKLKSSGGPKAKAEKEAPATLEVSVDDIVHHHKKKQLTAGTNLGYILDILIRSLGQDLISEYENVDAFGRNEEEQVGSDDEDTQSEARTSAKAADVLGFCHRKIRQLVSRAENQLKAFFEGTVSDRNIVIKLVAVIALFSQLRAQDKNIWWVNVDRGESTVPDEELKRLMKAIAGSLLAHPLFLYEPMSDDEDVPDSDEYARLRGLIFWLGAQSGVSLQLKPPFNEKIEARTTRIQTNQDFLALGDLVTGDEHAANTAEETIKVTNIELRAALGRAIAFRSRLNERLSALEANHEISPGDFAYNPKNMALGVRAVLHADSRFVELATPGGAAPKQFVTSSLIGISAKELEQ